MRDEGETKEQLVDELVGLRRRIAELETSQAERAWESEKRFRSVAQTASDAVIIFDSHENIIFWNQAAKDIFGYSTGETLGKLLVSIMPERFCKVLRTEMKQVISTGESDLIGKAVEATGVRKDGSEFPLELSLATWKAREGIFFTVIARDIAERKRAEEQLKKYRDHLEELVKERTAELARANEQLQQEITERRRVEEALRESEEELRAIFNSVGDGIALIDVTGKVIRVNKRITDVGGYAEEEIVGKRFEFLKMFPPQSIAKMLSNFTKLISGQQTPPFEVKVYTKAGEKMDVELRGSLLRQRGKTVGMVGVMRDITERKQAEEALRRSEEAYRLLFEQSADGIIIVAEGRIVRANRAICAFHGLPVEKVVGMNPVELVHPEDRSIGAQRIEAIQSGEPVSGSYVYRALRADGSVFWGEVRSKRIEWEGEPALQAIVRDITERVRAEEEIRKLSQFQERIIDNANVWLNVLDEKANVVLWNKAAEEISGYSREEVVGHDQVWEWLYPDEEYGNEAKAKAIALIERGGEEEENETTIRCKDGQIKVISWNSQSLVDERGTPTGSIALGRDVTERKRAEEELHKEREKFRVLVEESPLGVSVIREDGHYEYVNPKFVEIFGYTLEDIPTGREWFAKAFPDPECKNQAISTWVTDQKESKRGEARPRTFTVTCKDSSEKVIHFRPVTMEIGDQFVIYEDITERKHAEEALQEAEERFRTIFENTVIGLYRTTPDGRILMANPALVQMLGYSSFGELAQRNLEEEGFEPEYPRSGFKQRIGKEGQVIGLEAAWVRRDGKPLFIRESARAIRDEAGNTLYYEGAVEDITERKRLEHELEERRLYLESMLACAPDAIVTMDAQQNVLEWNLGAERLYGYSAEEVVGRNLDELITGSDANTFEEATGFTRQILAGEPLPPTETVRYRKDGSPVDVIVSASPILIGNEVVGVVTVYTDITERKRLEAQLRQAQKMEAIGQLAGGIAHDFNNLLTPIGGFAELLLQKAPQGSQQREYLHQIKIATERAAALTHQLRLFTRQEEGKHRPVQLNSVVEETRDLLERSIPKEITIGLRLEPELWAVEADLSQISQVLMNLCLNARDAMPNGGTLTLETRNVTLDKEWAQAILEAQPGRYVCLGVSDTGCGMSPEVQARLFEPFFTTKEVGEGTGLGLAVVYGIVKGHGGFVNVYSQVGRGSTLHVYLPAIEWAVEEREVEELVLPTGTETILVVDDEEMVLELGQRVLERCGYTVLTAEDGVQALEVYQAHQGEIALVVLDVVMPQMGGRECLHRLQELDPAVRVLIATGYTVNGSVRELVSEGALGVVEKPFNIEHLATMVRAVLDG